MLSWLGNTQMPALFLAPMAGYTDVAFRALCKQHGADVVVTEFVQSESLRRDVERVWATLDFTESQRPAGVQIFGAVPESMAAAAQLLEARLRPDFIDINYGCPAKNVVEQNAGAGLMREPVLAGRIAEAVVRAVAKTPVTAKMRLGWDSASIVAEDFARRLADAGVQAITVHGRTRSQGYSGEADWGHIARVVAAVALPVVGNGDIRDAATAVRRWRESGAAGLMVGRGALGNPWLFNEIKAALRGEPSAPPPSAAARWAVLRDYAEALLKSRRGGADTFNGDLTDVRWLLTRLHPLTHGLPGSRKVRARLSSCRTLADIQRLATEPETACG